MSMAERNYLAVEGSQFSSQEAQRIGPELERISQQDEGATTDAIVEASRENKILGPYFHWDADADLAMEQRKVIARHMARSILVRIKVAGQPVFYARAFHSVKVTVLSADGGGVRKVSARYVGIDDIARSPEMAPQVINRARRDLLGWAKRYEVYRQVLPNFDALFAPVFALIAAEFPPDEPLAAAE